MNFKSVVFDGFHAAADTDNRKNGHCGFAADSAGVAADARRWSVRRSCIHRRWQRAADDQRELRESVPPSFSLRWREQILPRLTQDCSDPMRRKRRDVAADERHLRLDRLAHGAEVY